MRTLLIVVFVYYSGLRKAGMGWSGTIIFFARIIGDDVTASSK